MKTIHAIYENGVFRPADVMSHATPEVVARDLPKELVIRIFEVAFDAGKLTPEGILGVWSAGPNARYEQRLERFAFDVEVLRVPAREGSRARHVLFMARR